MQVYLEFLDLMESFLLENIRELVGLLGIGGFLGFIALIGSYRVYVMYQNFQIKKLESAQNREKVQAEIDLINAQTAAQLKIADQKSEAEVTTRRDAMLSELIKISAKFSDTQTEAIRTSNSIGEILRIVQTQQANIASQMTTYRDEDEAYQAKMSVAAALIQDHAVKTFQIAESLPSKLDGGFERIMERLAEISKAADTQHATLARQLDDSHALLKTTILQIAVDVAAAAHPALQPIPEMVAGIGATNDPLAPAPSENVSEAPETKDGGADAQP